MDRRSFLGILGGLGGLGMPARAAVNERKTRFYVVKAMYLRHGAQASRVHELLGQAVLPALNEIHGGPKIYLEALVASHTPQVMAIYGFESLEQMGNLPRKLLKNSGLRERISEIVASPGPLVEHQTTTVLEATDYSPELTLHAEPPASRRIFELRVYHSPTRRQLRALHEGLAGPISIFHRAGMHPLLCSSTLLGANLPNLTYVIPFDSLATREKAWAALSADPEWDNLRKNSIDRHGQIASVTQISLFRATAYSPLR